MKDYIVYHANKFGTAGAGFTEVCNCDMRFFIPSISAYK